MATQAQRLVDLANRIAAEFKSRPRGVVWTISGKPGAGEVVPGVSPYGFTSTAARSFARARVAATAATTFIVKRNGAQVAQVTFAAGATVGARSAAVTWAADDFATVEAPATADATLQDISIGARA